MATDKEHEIDDGRLYPRPFHRDWVFWIATATWMTDGVTSIAADGLTGTVMARIGVGLLFVFFFTAVILGGLRKTFDRPVHRDWLFWVAVGLWLLGAGWRVAIDGLTRPVISDVAGGFVIVLVFTGIILGSLREGWRGYREGLSGELT